MWLISNNFLLCAYQFRRVCMFGCNFAMSILIMIIIILHLICLIVSEYYEKFLKDLHVKSQSETITGLLLMYPKYCIQVIEVNRISVACLKMTSYINFVTFTFAL